MTTRADCLALDAQDPLRALRDLFALPEGVNYLDGNSLGVLPRTTAARVAQVVQQEWGEGLIRSWNTAGWMAQPQRVGNKIARLIGAGEGEVVAADSTSLNLYKVLAAALRIAHADAPQRKVIVSERSNFPTDLYIAQSLAAQHGCTLELIKADEVAPRLARGDVAVLMLTQVNYRSGRMFDMAAVTAQAHAAGTLTVWDLAHSAGAVPVDLRGANADFAIGCGYKYLNGGPGAPAFVWVNPRHAERTDLPFMQPLSGWIGHASPFSFDTAYLPAAGIARYLCGTPAVIGMAALECGVDTLLAAEPLGGMAALRKKSLALTTLFITQWRERLGAHPLTLASPEDPALRGSQVSLACPEGGYAVMQALIARGVIGDFRAGNGGKVSPEGWADAQPAPQGGQGTRERPVVPCEPDLLRFGFTPLYTQFVDVYDAVTALSDVLTSGEWREARFNQKAAVT